MDLMSLNEFLEKHSNLKEEKPGLNEFLVDIYWREQDKVTIDEAEHLAKINFTGPANNDSGTWARELERHRGERR